jgi:hypothetical protein
MPSEVWQGSIEPATAEDAAADRDVQAAAARDPEKAFWAVRKRQVFYRVGAARLGEPLPKMDCGRDTGHIGSGLYFFGTYAAAVRSAGGQRIYRIVGGPEHPLIAGSSKDSR